MTDAGFILTIKIMLVTYLAAGLGFGAYAKRHGGSFAAGMLCGGIIYAGIAIPAIILWFLVSA